MLTAAQRALLVERVVEARSKIGIWIAERFEALSTEELLASGSTAGRDHAVPIELEWYWRARHERFEKHVMRIADRRVRASIETELDGFRSCLEDTLDGPQYDRVFERVLGEVRGRVHRKSGKSVLFREWIEEREGQHGSFREQAISWRALEIVMERVLRKPQKGLFDTDSRLPSAKLIEQVDSPVKHAGIRIVPPLRTTQESEEPGFV